MSIWSLTYRQSVFKRYHSHKHFSEFLPTTWRQKSASIRYGTKLRHCHPMYSQYRASMASRGKKVLNRPVGDEIRYPQSSRSKTKPATTARFESPSRHAISTTMPLPPHTASTYILNHTLCPNKNVHFLLAHQLCSNRKRGRLMFGCCLKNILVIAVGQII